MSEWFAQPVNMEPGTISLEMLLDAGRRPVQECYVVSPREYDLLKSWFGERVAS